MFMQTFQYIYSMLTNDVYYLFYVNLSSFATISSNNLPVLQMSSSRRHRPLAPCRLLHLIGTSQVSVRGTAWPAHDYSVKVSIQPHSKHP